MLEKSLWKFINWLKKHFYLEHFFLSFTFLKWSFLITKLKYVFIEYYKVIIDFRCFLYSILHIKNSFESPIHRAFRVPASHVKLHLTRNSSVLMSAGLAHMADFRMFHRQRAPALLPHDQVKRGDHHRCSRLHDIDPTICLLVPITLLSHQSCWYMQWYLNGGSNR